ncbi:MAG: ferredoxin family protein [Bacteroidota bacterium]|nr:ferredoxin family protein [Bacteroidota bacterium]
MAAIRGTVEIDIENCKGCELCVVACPQKCLKLSTGINKQGYHYAVLFEDTCTGCVNCALVCPDAVITVYREEKKTMKKVPLETVRDSAEIVAGTESPSTK